MKGCGAVISDCGRYRYALWRMWDNRLPSVLFIGLNPSTADATKDDRSYDGEVHGTCPALGLWRHPSRAPLCSADHGMHG